MIPHSHKSPPVALTVAGSDSSSGAGMQADLKTFASCGVYGLCAVTCVVAEVPGNVSSVFPVDADVVRDQIALGLRAFPVAAIKTGMLYSAEIIACVAECLRKQGVGKPGGPALVVDPVMVATSGDALLLPDAVGAYRSFLFPLATLLTPNLDEASALLGRKISRRDEMESAATELRCALGADVLLKGGHLRGDVATDLLATAEGVRAYEAPYIAGISTHGTGCTYSAAITAGLALGLGLQEAVADSKRFVTRAIAGSFAWERANGPTTQALNHGVSPREP